MTFFDNATTDKLRFLLSFHSNFGHILYRFPYTFTFNFTLTCNFLAIVFACMPPGVISDDDADY